VGAKCMVSITKVASPWKHTFVYRFPHYIMGLLLFPWSNLGVMSYASIDPDGNLDGLVEWYEDGLAVAAWLLTLTSGAHMLTYLLDPRAVSEGVLEEQWSYMGRFVAEYSAIFGVLSVIRFINTKGSGSGTTHFGRDTTHPYQYHFLMTHI
jgi:hypothetical protein